MESQKKRTFLVVDDEADIREAIGDALRKQYPDSTVYTAENGSVGLQKLKNVPPDLMLLDLDMPKLTGIEVLENMKRSISLSRVPVIVVTGLEQDSKDVQYARELGLTVIHKPFKLQYLAGVVEGVFNSQSNQPAISSLSLTAGDILFNEGDESCSVYLLRKGKLRVYQERNGEQKQLGEIISNELVGEIAFIDKKPRTATVEAMEDSELVELPIGDFDAYLDKQPIWMKTVFRTLINRLRSVLN